MILNNKKVVNDNNKSVKVAKNKKVAAPKKAVKTDDKKVVKVATVITNFNGIRQADNSINKTNNTTLDTKTGKLVYQGLNSALKTTYNKNTLDKIDETLLKGGDSYKLVNNYALISCRYRIVSGDPKTQNGQKTYPGGDLHFTYYKFVDLAKNKIIYEFIASKDKNSNITKIIADMLKAKKPDEKCYEIYSGSYKKLNTFNYAFNNELLNTCKKIMYESSKDQKMINNFKK